MKENPWTDERKALLKNWWLYEQLSSTRIVELFDREGFHTTRNAVIGAVHRSDWWEGMSRARGAPRPRAKKPEGWRRKAIDKTVKALKKKGVYDQLDLVVIEPLPPPPVRLRTPPVEPTPEPVAGKPMFLSVVQIGPNQCRYWYGESRSQAGRKHETGYCGHQVVPGMSWCDAHMRLVYAKAPSPGRQSIPVKF